MIATIPKNVYRCNCEERPRCQMYSCEGYADGFALVPIWDRNQPDRATSKFTCLACWEYYVENWKKPILGFTKPDWWPKDEEWKPQITDMIEQARIQINERERREHGRKMHEAGLDLGAPMILQKGVEYTPAQLKQLVTLSRRTRELRQSGGRG